MQVESICPPPRMDCCGAQRMYLGSNGHYFDTCNRCEHVLRAIMFIMSGFNPFVLFTDMDMVVYRYAGLLPQTIYV